MPQLSDYTSSPFFRFFIPRTLIGQLFASPDVERWGEFGMPSIDSSVPTYLPPSSEKKLMVRRIFLDYGPKEGFSS